MQTVLATFDDGQEAQSAVDELIAQGFSRGSVHIQAGVPGISGTPASPTSPEEGRGMLSSVGHFFSHLFGSDGTTHADNYSEAVRRGSSVVAVDANSDAEVEKVTALLNKMGSIDVERRAAEWKSKGWTGFDANAGLLTQDEQDFARDSVPVVQEELHVGKRTVNVGGLRVIKRLTETPVSQIINLRRERATIERRPVDRPATEAEFANFKEGTVEVREMAEEAVVGKTARVVEEVRVGKDVTERASTVSDTVRRTDVDVERVGSVPQGRLVDSQALSHHQEEAMGLFDREKTEETLIDRDSVAVIPILSEVLDVHKTIADAGGIRIHKRVLEKSVVVDEPLLRQSIQVTHTPIGREIAAPMPIRYEGDVTVIPIVEERLVTVRQLFLVEEVRLTRVEQIDRVPQTVTLRREEAFVERQNMASGTWQADSSYVRAADPTANKESA